MDVSARTGGDEFAVILPSAELEKALVLAERIRRRVADSLSHLVTGDTGGTVSIGLACCAPAACASAAASIVRAADEALYEAKRTGRNRVVVRWLSDSVDFLPHRAASRT
jgi:two-component system cell cycle response regulator